MTNTPEPTETINLNDQVRVVLNEQGVEIMRRDHEGLYSRFRKQAPPFFAPSTTEPTTFQLWTLMQTFGPHISLGTRPPFSTQIEIVKP